MFENNDSYADFIRKGRAFPPMDNGFSDFSSETQMKFFIALSTMDISLEKLEILKN